MSLTELEETEVSLQLSEIIYQEVVKEAASEVQKIQTRNSLRMVDYWVFNFRLFLWVIGMIVCFINNYLRIMNFPSKDLVVLKEKKDFYEPEADGSFCSILRNIWVWGTSRPYFPIRWQVYPIALRGPQGFTSRLMGSSQCGRLWGSGLLSQQTYKTHLRGPSNRWHLQIKNS